MSRLRFLLPAFATAATAVAALPAASSAATACSGAHLTPTASHTAQARHATFCLLNGERTRHGLPRLRLQVSLTHAAVKYSHLMVRQGFFAHVSPGGSTMAERIKHTRYLRGVRSWSLAENLAWGAGRASTPAQIVRAWMRSPGHRRNILDRGFREIGIGVAPGAPRRAGSSVAGATYTTEFGRRQHR
jgi:uncharacterized protein YkwD